MSFINFYPEHQQKIKEISIEDKEEFLGSNDEFTYIYLVRHGQSVLNVPDENEVKYAQGQSPKVPLTEKGQKQAEELAKKLQSRIQKLNFLIMTSTAKRAIDTAKPLLIEMGKNPLRYFSSNAFLELGSGKWEGASKEDPEYKKEYNQWKALSSKDKFCSPKVSTGESYSEVAFRALNGLSKVVVQLKSDETPILFTHHMLMNAVKLSLTGEVLSEELGSPLPDLDVKNGDIMVIRIPKEASIEHGEIVEIIHSDLE